MTIFEILFRRTTVLSTALLLSSLLCAPAARGMEPGNEEAQPTTMEKIRGFTDRASELAMRAMGLLGIRYKRGGNTPESGLDCSGFVRYVFKDAWGKELPRTAEEISRVGEKIEAHELQPGDLVFYNTLRHAFSHVGIYLGDNKFIHAPSSGGQVRIESMDLGYWKARFNGARRISEPAVASNN
ncbi:MAG: C40 family peptidase [Burkholderiales bacterium]|nr:C40 family peptidase [Burkholderiales bacterium]